MNLLVVFVNKLINMVFNKKIYNTGIDGNFVYSRPRAACDLIYFYLPLFKTLRNNRSFPHYFVSIPEI